MGVLKGFDEDRQKFGVLPLFRRQFLITSVELLQLGDQALILLLSTNNTRQLARQQNAVTLRIYFEYRVFHDLFQSSLLYS